MSTLTKKEEIFNEFNHFYSEIINYNQDNFDSISKVIKDKMQGIGAKIYENWIIETIKQGKENNCIERKAESNNEYDKYSFKGFVQKTYLTILGEITIQRAYYYNNEKRKGFFPIEEKYPFLKDYCLPDVKELICYTACIDPFGSSHEILGKLSGIKVSTAEIQKVAKKIGRKLVLLEEEKIENPPKYEKSRKKIDKMAISMDGAMINTYNDWKEVKSGVVYEIEEKNNKIYSKNKTYVSRIEDYLSFSKRIKEEARRRHYLDAKELIVIGDGARWIWDLSEKEFPFAIKIIDWYHAKEHLHNIANLLYSQNTTENVKFMEYIKDLLYEGETEKIKEIVHDKIIELKMIENIKDLSKIHTEIEYFVKNKDKMQYKYFESKGYPIGSGVIEGACKQLVQLRLKRNGMKWKKEGAHCVLQLRCLYLSNRWDEVVKILKKAS